MTKEPTAQLYEAAMQILYGPNCPFEPSDRLPCTAVELAAAMAEQGMSDRETVEELRRNNQAWQTELYIATQALAECITNDGAHCLAYGADTPTLRARLASISNTARAALAKIDQSKLHSVCGGVKCAWRTRLLEGTQHHFPRTVNMVLCALK